MRSFIDYFKLKESNIINLSFNELKKKVNKKDSLFADSLAKLKIKILTSKVKNRSIMPVIEYDQIDQLKSWLLNHNITFDEITCNSYNLIPSQSEIYTKKVIDNINKNYTDGIVIISKDNKIIDGHHRWASNLIIGNHTKCIKFNETYEKLNELIFYFSEYILNNTRKT